MHGCNQVNRGMDGLFAPASQSPQGGILFEVAVQGFDAVAETVLVFEGELVLR